MKTEVWVWTVIAAFGVAVQVFLVADAVYRLRRVRRVGADEDIQRVLIGHVRANGSYWMMHAVFLYIGLRVIVGFDFGAVAWLLIFAQFCLLYAGLADFRDRLYWRRRSRRESHVDT